VKKTAAGLVLAPVNAFLPWRGLLLIGAKNTEAGVKTTPPPTTSTRCARSHLSRGPDIERRKAGCGGQAGQGP